MKNNRKIQVLKAGRIKKYSDLKKDLFQPETRTRKQLKCAANSSISMLPPILIRPGVKFGAFGSIVVVVVGASVGFGS